MFFHCISEGQTRKLNQHIEVTFLGTELHTAFNGIPMEPIPASPGDCFDFYPRGSKVAPIIVKKDVPQHRGERICWGLSFAEPEKRASSYQDFMARYQNIATRYNPNCHYTLIEQERYAFLFAPKIDKRGNDISAKKKSESNKPLLAWVADDITDTEIDAMVAKFKFYRSIHCSIEYLKLK